jgi:hypothetical protein
MQSSLLDFVWSFVRERGGALLGLVGKGWSALRAVLGRARGLARELLKKALGFAAEKLAPIAAAASKKMPGAQLLARAQEVLRSGARGERIASEPVTSAAPSPAVRGAEPAAAAAAAATEAAPPVRREPAAASPAPAKTARAASGTVFGGSSLARLAPLLARAVVSGLSRKRGLRAERRPFASAMT